MNCHRIRELIATDYIDKQMEDKQIWLVERHLAQCPGCVGYLSVVKNETVNPFVNASKDAPDELLWAHISQNIKEDQHQQLLKSLQPGIWERLKSAVYIPRPAFALATIVTMIFVIGSTGQLFFSGPVVKINGQDQVKYLSSLLDEPADLDSNSGNDSQTPIEKVFL